MIAAKQQQQQRKVKGNTKSANFSFPIGDSLLEVHFCSFQVEIYFARVSNWIFVFEC